ncbi:hypothetical protein PLEOSDRAFT_1039375, partial [Pleurotus ostreatus PC15]
SVTTLEITTTMENPHAERQAVLLERILKNSSKCTEMILELNHCLEEVLRANSAVQTAADLSTKYRKNVQYNMEVTKENACASLLIVSPGVLEPKLRSKCADPAPRSSL